MVPFKNHHWVQYGSIVPNTVTCVTRPHQTVNKVRVTVTIAEWGSSASALNLEESHLSHVVWVFPKDISPVRSGVAGQRSHGARHVPLVPALAACFDLSPGSDVSKSIMTEPQLQVASPSPCETTSCCFHDAIP